MNIATAMRLERLFDSSHERRYITIPRARIIRIIFMFLTFYTFFMLVPSEWFWIMFGGVALVTAFLIIYSAVWASFGYSRLVLFASTALFCVVVKVFSSPIRKFILYSTHIHKLAERIPSLNENRSESAVDSLVAVASGSQRTFKIARRASEGTSRAKDIASKYGF